MFNIDDSGKTVIHYYYKEGKYDDYKDKVIIMHPGPINRGVELDSDIADGEHSVILDQVTNGVAVRMAVLFLLAGGRNENA